MRIPRLLAFTGFVLLIGSALGCMSAGLVLKFNGRTLEFNKIDKMSFPRGIEMTSFKENEMRINGRETVKINGDDVYVDDDEVTIGKNKLTVQKDKMVYIGDEGSYEVRPKTGPGSGGKSWFDQLFR